MAEVKEKIKNVEFLRILGMFTILLFHLAILMIKGFSLTPEIPLFKMFLQNSSDGDLWVDFFFIISGFFLFYTVDLKTNFLDYFKMKLLRLLPVILFAECLYGFCSLFHLLSWDHHINIFTMFLLNNVGLTTSMGNLHPTWYVSVLFWVSMFYFYLAKILKKDYLNLLIALIILFSYVFVSNSTRYAPHNSFNLLNVGMIRGLGGLGIGYFLNEILKIETLSQHVNFVKTKYIYTIVELYTLGFIIYYTIFHKMHFDRVLPLLILYFVVLFYSFINKKGFLSEFLNKDVFGIFSRYCYSIYVVHVVVYDLLVKNLWVVNPNFVLSHNILNFILPLLLSILFGIFTYHLVEQPAAKYLKETWFGHKAKTQEQQGFVLTVGA